MSLLRDQDRARDVAQEAMMGALANNIKLTGKKLTLYLNRAVRNGVKKVWRDGASQSFKEQGAARSEALPSALDELTNGECSDILRRAVSELSEPYRSAISLHFFEDLSSPEIAERLNSNESTVRSHIKRGLERLRQNLDGNYGRTEWTAGLLVMLNHKTGWVPGPGDRLIPTTTKSLPLSASAVTLGALFVALVSAPILYFSLQPSTRDQALAGAPAPATLVPGLSQAAATPHATALIPLVPAKRVGESIRQSSPDPQPAQAEELEPRPGGGLYLSVLDAISGAPLGDLRVVEGGIHDYPHARLTEERRYLAQGEASPVRIDRVEGESLRDLWVGAEGYQWQRLKIENPGAHMVAERTILLDRGGDLLLTYEGDYEVKGHSLVLSRPGGSELEYMQVIDEFPIDLEGLPTGSLRLEVVKALPRSMVANGTEFYSIVPPAPPLYRQSIFVSPFVDNSQELEIFAPVGSSTQIDFDLELRLSQTPQRDFVRLNIVPATPEGYVQLPVPMRLRVPVEDGALRSDSLHNLSLPEGAYRLGVMPSLYYSELYVGADSLIIIEADPAESVTIDLGDSFPDAEERPSQLMFSRLIDEDHFPLDQVESIDWSLASCSVQLVPGRYVVRPMLPSALVSNMRGMTFEVKSGEALRRTFEWDGVGLERPQYGFHLEVRHGQTILPHGMLPTSLTPVGHDGELVPFMFEVHPFLQEPGRYPAFPTVGFDPSADLGPGIADIRVSAPGDYILGPIHIPPYRPIPAQAIRVEPDFPVKITIQLSLD